MYPTTRLSRADRQARTRDDLLEAAARVFVECGFEAASIEAIAEEAGYTRGAFYSNFQSKEQLFAELLQQRVYSLYGRLAEDAGQGRGPSTLREAGEQLAQIQRDAEGSWLFRLWLELLAHASRDEAFREIAAGFWSTNRKLTAGTIEASFTAAGTKPAVPPDHLATAMIALDIGLALQHFVDPEAAPLELYPELYQFLFEQLSP